MTRLNGGQRDEMHPNRQVGPEQFVTTTQKRFYGDWDELHDRDGREDYDGDDDR